MCSFTARVWYGSARLMLLSTAFLDELRARTVLSAVIAPHVKIIRAGTEWKGCCPFHREKTPSFIVNDDKGFYHCFGCGAHGDAITFLTNAAKLPFLEAVRLLSDRAGMPLPDAQPERTQSDVRPIIPPKKGGARLSRSETVTVRLDPKLNYLCELAARAQRRTKSSFIEWAVAEAMKSVSLPEIQTSDGDFNEPRAATIHETALQLWHVDEPDRVTALALMAPSLLTHEEQLVWHLVRENGYVWRGHFSKNGEWTWQIAETGLIRERLREHWDIFKAVAQGEEPKERLPKWQKHKADDPDDDVPF